MKFALKMSLSLAASVIFSLAASADNVNSELYKIEGTDTVTLPINQENSIADLSMSPDENISELKTIKIIKIKPSAEMTARNKNARVILDNEGGEFDYSKGITSFKNSQGAVDIGMANVPVLDQGREGTCLIFAATAGIDARINAGDYIDQQCLIALNLSMGKNLWNGANNTDVFNTLGQYGIVPKGHCFGSQYPDKYQVVTPSQYMSASVQKFASYIRPGYAGGISIYTIQSYLNSGYRVLLAFALADRTGDRISVNGFDIKMNGIQKSGGLWACSQPGNFNNYCTQQGAYHEVVVTGYDNRQQLLKVRNSWGGKMGDEGEYYMTYGFANTMGVEYTIVQ